MDILDVSFSCTSVDAVSSAQWDTAGRTSGLNKDFLSIVEKSKVNNLKHNYLLLSCQNDIVARANLYEVNFDFSTTDQSLKDCIKVIKHWQSDFMDFKVLELGLFTMIGDGLDCIDERYLLPAMEATAQHMISQAEQLGSDFLLIRDIPLARYQAMQAVLQPLGFLPCSGFTNAVLYNQWQDFEQYLHSMKSKSRTKAKAALNLTEKFGIRVQVLTDYQHLAPQMAALWRNVNQSSKDYSREQLNSEFFALTQHYLPQHSEVITFEHQGKLVGFMYNLIGADEYIMLDWGVDYDFEYYQSANLYRAASLLSVQRMIELGKQRLELGITNYTPKLFLGATLEPKLFFVRHRTDPDKTEALARALTDNIQHDAELTIPACYQTQDRPCWNELQWREFIHREIDGCDATDAFAVVQRFGLPQQLKLAGLYSYYPEFCSGQFATIKNSAGADVVLLGTNSYLGLNTHPHVVAAAIAAVDRYGTGCSGSPLLNGTLDLHNRLVQRITAFSQKPAALLCSTGYQTNLAALSALIQPETLVLMDERNHRSLFDGVALAGGKMRVFAHRNYTQLESILKRSQGYPVLVVTDSVFSMEGSLADLPALVQLKQQYGFRLFVDESHAVGVLGQTGAGAAEHFGCLAQVDVVMATFSKSFASLGGYIAASCKVVNYIKHKGAGHIFSASMPAASAAAALAALDLIEQGSAQRQQLHDNCRYFATGLQAIGFQLQIPPVPIIHLILGHPTLTLAAYQTLLRRHVYVNPIMPPAVPASEAGFRISLMASHRQTELDQALAEFDRLYQEITSHGYSLTLAQTE